MSQPDAHKRIRTSERKAQAIYDAVHDVLMRFRITLERERQARTRRVVTDTDLAVLQSAAASAAVAAYGNPLGRKR